MGTSNNVNGSFTIIPQNVHEILTGSDDGKEVRVNNKSVFKGTFAKKQGAVLNDIRHLSYARKVTWNDTGEKTGFSGFLKVIGNILHNFRSHFYSSEKALSELKRDIKALENYGTSERMKKKEYEQLKVFLTEIKQINKNNETSLQNLKKNVNECLDRYDKSQNDDANRNIEILMIRNMIDTRLSEDSALSRCIEMFKNLKPSSEDVEKFEQNLTLQWQINLSLGDRLEQILEKRANVYEELHKT